MRKTGPQAGLSRCGLAALAGAAVLLGGCVHEGVGAPVRTDKLDGVASQSGLGSYLAGRYANAQRDTALAASFYGKALDADPGNQAILQRAFLLDISDGRIRSARKLAQRIVQERGNDRLARLVLAIDEFRRHNHVVVRQHLDQSGEGQLTELMETLVRAWSFADERRTDAAVLLLDRLAERTGMHGYVAFQKALMFDLVGRNSEAETAYAVARESEKGGGLRVVQAYGRFLERMGRQAAAIAVYEDYLKRVSASRMVAAELKRAKTGVRPKSLVPTPAAGLAEAVFGVSAFLASRDPRVDLPLLYVQLALHLRPNFPAAQLLLADLYRSIGQWEAATAALGKVDKHSVYARQARVLIAHYLHRMGRVKEAVASMRRLSAEDPSDLEAVVTLATMLRMSSRFAEAADSYGQAIAMLDEVERRHWPLYFYHGVTLERSGRWRDAEDSLKKALRLNGEQPEVLNYLGYSWIDRGMRVDEAMDMIRRALDIRTKVERRPNDGFLIDSLGWGHFRLGEYAEAVRHLERAAELEPGDPTINHHLGDAYWMAGRRIEARFQWKHVLTLNPGPVLVKAIQYKLEFGLAAPVPTRRSDNRRALR